MARKNQKLINYHTSSKTTMPSGSSVDYGEIVVRHNAETPELLIKIGEDSFGVFQASGAVQTAINSAVSTAKTALDKDISDLESKVDKFSGATVAEFTSLKTYADDTFATKTELQTAQTNITNAYTKAVGDAKVEIYNSATTFATNAVNTAKTALDGNISSLETSLTGHVADFKQFKTDVQDTYATKAELKSTSGSIITAYEKAVGDAKVEVYDSATTFATNVKNELNGTIRTVKSNLETLSGVVESISTDIGSNYVTTGALNTTVTTLEGKISTAQKAATDASSAYTDTQIAAAKEYSDGKLTAATDSLKQIITGVDNKVTALSGNVHTTITNVQTTLTKTINDKIATAYRFQGSCTYAELANKEKVNGYVWNVTDAHDNVPAGTNYAWSEKENKWDALGGTVDLSPYAKTEDVNKKIETINQTNTNLQSAIDSVSSATKTLVNEVSAATKANYATKNELKSTSGSIITAYTNAIAAAKKEAIETASGYTDTQVKAAKDSIKQTTDTISSDLSKLSASTVSIKTTADSAVQTGTTNSGVVVAKNGTSLDFDFLNMIINCGEF